MEYTTKTEVQSYLLTNIDAAFDARLTMYIKAMSEFADDKAGYPIFREDPETRLYDGNNERSIGIDMGHTITEVLVDGVAPADENLLEFPYNSPMKWELRLKSGTFTYGQANVSVTGVFCRFMTLPEKVKWAVTVLVAGIVNQVNNQTEGVKSEKVGEYAVTYRDQKERADFQMAMDILNNLRPLNF